jgi:hypothetical protein
MQSETFKPQVLRKKINLTGTLKDKGESGIGRSGKPFHKFIIADKQQKLYTCWAFNDKADIAAKKLDKIGMEVLVFGVYKDDEAEHDCSIWVSSFSSPQASLSHDEQLVKTYGSFSAAKRRIEEVHEAKTAAGYVLCQEIQNTDLVFRWVHKSDAVEFSPGQWKSKIEYLMDTLGPSVVVENLRPFVRGMKVESGRGLLGGFDVLGYKEVIAKMLIEAAKVAPMAQIQQEMAQDAWMNEVGNN